MERLFQKKTVYQFITLEYLTLAILTLKETGTTTQPSPVVKN